MRYRGRLNNGVTTDVELLAGLSRRIPAKLNSPALTYAPCISADGRTLLFSRARRKDDSQSVIYRASRTQAP